ncbi:acetyl-CoA C-acetyltransferase [Demequina zhanjiangensis]|uniref:Probable acetyl-CoA acetyltransferase n=1 Tax=Demequina zhanjiangensis TaxID=3051659 RepID=A0ABT8G2N9_9MICO|nr:acetyl-CoA C-acetyltransferase [Demequina sp. SYSU T00b26]MDN4473272.1 acetyl-CoA C-acetyltransferase [Demequina sp. SYSU T00b26]
MSDIVIVGAVRTPQGRLQGALSSLTAVELGAAAINGALAHAGVDAASVGQVIMGQVLQAGCGQNPARQAAIAAGVPWSAPAVTVNKVCLSGLAAVIDASRVLRLGDADVVVAGGMESMSQAPHLLTGTRRGWSYGSVEALDHMAHDGLTDAIDRESMGLSTERHNARLRVSREAQDSIAARSHQAAAAAQVAGLLDGEIVPVEVPQRRGEPVTVAQDEGVRADTTEERLAGLRPAFDREGTLTAGNSSQISDGAAALVLTTRAYADRHGLTVLATLGAYGQVAGPDNSLQEQPAHALLAACEKDAVAPTDLDVIEINEAFAAVVARSAEVLGVSPETVNVEGGGISLGHPIGASGARLVVHAVHALNRRGGGTAGVSLCGGGGQGEALLLTA